MTERQTPAKDAKERRTKAAPERTCIAGGGTGSQGELLRFVVGPDDSIVPDVESKLPGRGLYLTSSREALEGAIKKRAFSRAARREVKVPPGLTDLVERILISRAIEGLALSRRGGALICGFDKVETLLRKEPPAALFEAADGAFDGRRKLFGLAQAWKNHKKGPIPVIGSLDSGELGLAFGRQSVIHAALENSGFAARILADFKRLDGFRPCVPSAWEEMPVKAGARE